VGCYIWYSEEGTGRGRSRPRSLLAVPNVTANPSTASTNRRIAVQWSAALCAHKGLNQYDDPQAAGIEPFRQADKSEPIARDFCALHRLEGKGKCKVNVYSSGTQHFASCQTRLYVYEIVECTRVTTLGVTHLVNLCVTLTDGTTKRKLGVTLPSRQTSCH